MWCIYCKDDILLYSNSYLEEERRPRLTGDLDFTRNSHTRLYDVWNGETEIRLSFIFVLVGFRSIQVEVWNIVNIKCRLSCCTQEFKSMWSRTMENDLNNKNNNKNKKKTYRNAGFGML